MPFNSSNLSAFLAAYPTQGSYNQDKKLDPDALAAVPTPLHELYHAVGMFKLGDGMLQLIEPERYRGPYADFFGGDTTGRTPFLLNGLGEVVAYKQISPREAEISILHTYGPQLEVLAYDLGDFFDRVLLTDDGLRQVINVPLFRQLRARLGRLRPDQVYGFDPGVLREEPEGTKPDASYFDIVEAREHLRLLLKRAQEE